MIESQSPRVCGILEYYVRVSPDSLLKMRIET
jgi:hypothetical protein